MDEKVEDIVLDSVGNGAEDAAGSDAAGDDFKMDPEQLQAYIKQLQEQMTRQAAGGGGGGGPAGSIPPIVLIIAFVVFFSAIGLFSYKLIRSLSEKERKREEKRKLKEAKKKK